MDDDDSNKALEAAEAAVARTVGEILDEVADEFATAVEGATELVAARFSVGSIARMWTTRVPRVMRRLFGVAENAAQAAADDIGAPLDDTWTDLPTRYEDGRLPTGLGQYATTTEHLLRAVGDTLAETARRQLAAGLDAGEDVDQLRTRLRTAFRRDGAQLGTARQERTAATEATRAWNTATLEAGKALSGPDRPLVKQWRTRGDRRVRKAHDDADGQLQLLGEPFRVGGVDMAGPGDPTAPASLTVNCFPGDTLVQVPSGVRRIFRRWYEGPLVEVHTKDGGKLAGTPNHPLLTNTGWKPLEGVEVGDQLIGAPVGVRVGAGDPDVENMPTSLAELYRAAHEAGMPSGVVGGRVDFHGDVADGGVEVVTVDSDLWPHSEAPGGESVHDTVLHRVGNGPVDLPRPGDLRSPGQGHGVRRVREPTLSAPGLIGGGGQGCALLEREALHAQPVGFTRGTDLHAVGRKSAADGGPRDHEGAREGELGLPGVVAADDLRRVELRPADAATSHLFTGAPDLNARSGEDAADTAVGDLVSPHQVLQGLTGRVALHDVVRVERRSFSGHVYNLETAGGWYIANDVVSHNCRCRLRVSRAPARRAAAAYESISASPGHVCGTQEELSVSPSNHSVTAASGPHTGAMIALIPTEDDAARLAIEGGEDADELHLTLYFLGDQGGDWTEDQRQDLAGRVRSWLADLGGPVIGRAFGANHWNAGTDSPSWVWAVGDDRDADDDAPGLTDIHDAITEALEDTRERPELPRQHSPWSPHVCAIYTGETWPLEELVARLGPITFDRVRLAFGGDRIDIPLQMEDPMPTEETTAAGMPTRAWSTPGDAALAFEDQQTGDGRLFTPGSLAWSGPGPWPLQYADEMLAGHEGAELAGAIESLDRDGDRITATGVLYLGQRAGAEATMLLEEGAPLGVSVDLDDVDVQFIDRTMGQDDVALVASLPSASVMRLSDGGWAISAATSGEWTASADGALSRTRHTIQLVTLPGGTIAASVVQAAFAGTGVLTAAAGDPDEPDAPVVGEQRSGDILMRITRARLRGATLVAMPAYDRARIVLTPSEEPVPGEVGPEYAAAASGPGPDHHRVVEYVRSSPTPVSARQAATALGLTITQARGHLARAVKAGRLVRLAPGAYVGPSSIGEGPEVTAALSGDTSLPVHADRDAEWDGDAAASRVLDHATVEGEVDPAQLGAAFLYRSPDADPATRAAYRLGFADVIDGELRIIPAGVFAVAGVLQGARGGIDLPADETDALRDRVEDLYERLATTFDDPSLRAPWDTDTNDEEEDEEMRELEASAWTAMRSADPMPAAWFREPTVEELPPGSGGVHYVDGRVYGWVAQAGEPHAGYPGKKLTIESLGDIDTTHFLRARFALDDGTLVKAGAFTMNVGHHRDGAECETDACQFDDTRTVAAVVTVGMNSRGMWFSGAAAPWLSEWDRAVFQACQPSYHMKQGRGRRWQLRAVLSVPVPGHSSPLLASAVAERSNLALAASASGLLTHTPDTAPDTGTAGHGHDLDGPSTDGRTSPDTGHDAGPASTDVSALVAALTNPAVLDQLAAALRDRETAREAEMRAEVERLTALVV